MRCNVSIDIPDSCYSRTDELESAFSPGKVMHLVSPSTDATTMLPVTEDARHRMVLRARPEIVTQMHSYSASKLNVPWKWETDAKMTLPPLVRSASADVRSENHEGIENGKVIRRGVCEAI